MAEEYTWRETRGRRSIRLPGPDNVGWWTGISVALAIVLHLAILIVLGKIRVFLPFQEAAELRTKPIQLEQVITSPPPESTELAANPTELEPEDTASMLDELDKLASLPEDIEVDISPNIDEMELAVKPEDVIPQGVEEGVDLGEMIDFVASDELSGAGILSPKLPEAAEGQVVVDPGSLLQEVEMDAVAESLLKKGSETGAPQKLDGVASLDEMVSLSEGALLGKTAMLPSDLLFEYDSATLRESARVGLMKLALLIERNPKLFCIIDGHSDLFGGDTYNLDLSRRRAAAVKEYLVQSLKLPGENIITRGLGKSRPLVKSGDIDAQQPNRRVEIRMRKEQPNAAVAAAPQVEDKSAAKPDDAILVQPNREIPAIPVEDGTVPRAILINEEEAQEPIPKALPVDEQIPKARIIEESEEDIPQAIPIEP